MSMVSFSFRSMVWFTAAFFFMQSSAFSQNDDEKNMRDLSFAQRMYVGGNLSGSWSSFGGFLEISPLAGYRLSKGISAGITTTYKYFKGINPYYGVEYNTSVWGGGAFARVDIFRGLFAVGEAELLNTDAFNNLTGEFQRKFIPIMSAGLGIKSPPSPNNYSYFMVLYDFVGDLDSPYPLSPFIIKIGLVFPIAD